MHLESLQLDIEMKDMIKNTDMCLEKKTCTR